ncbi:hypothetical protein FGG08_006151 [Glutinoglossum americanum]|uniref:Ubiquitin-like modifier HUB1 n=1 Tax=Glutinoglossum americanum TaxID=1670608 RepID=A0A9P8I7Z0_9PEZI|nr:hypothetical protein FGG08_006151 [Glutinoglossum americanum]
MSDREDRRRSRSPRRRSPVEDDARYRRYRDDDNQRESPRRSPAEDDARYRRRDDDNQRDSPRRRDDRRGGGGGGGGGGFRWKDRRREDDRSTSNRRERRRNDRGGRDVDRGRDDRDYYSRGADRDAGRKRRNSKSPPARPKDTVTPTNEKQADKPDKPDKPEKPSKPKKAAAPQEPMIIVHVNDRLGTKAAIPCLASDPIKLFKAQVAARIGREPHEIMLKRQGEKPFKDFLTLEDYGVSNGVQLDL